MALPERDLPLQDLHMTWQRTRSVGAGLYNLGNACFVNSVLQCLTYTAPLANYMLSRQHSQSCVQQGFCMMCTMQAHIQEVLSCSGGVIRPEGVVSQLPRIGPHFQVGTQEDAHEFFCCIVDAMQRACLGRDSNWDTSFQANTVINQVFGGLLRSRVTCLSCQATSDTYEAFRDVPLAITDISSVHQALEGFVTAELLDGYRCGRCKRLGFATKGFTIHRSPSILTLCLKRFDPFTGRKINTVVKYPVYLKLGAYTSQASEEPLIYSLYAVLVHRGSSCHEGHYYCFVKAGDGRWYKMDDESVVPSDTETVLCQQAYLLFYARHHDLTPEEDAECQETKSTCVAEPGLGLKGSFSEGIEGLRNHKGGENTHRMPGKRQTRGSAGTPPRHCIRKTACSDTRKGQKLTSPQPDCSPPRQRRARCVEMHSGDPELAKVIPKESYKKEKKSKENSGEEESEVTNL